MSQAEFRGRARRLREARRLIVKVGSALLVDAKSGRLNRAWLESLGDDLARAAKRGQQLIVVSSGAIALGRRPLGLDRGQLRLEESQAAAAVGQIRLAHAWQEILEERGLAVAQVLLTLEDTEERQRYLNARATLNTLLALGAVPVINENDTVATAEIRYGDNDRLAARVAQMASAECLVLLVRHRRAVHGRPRPRPAGALHPRGARAQRRGRGDGVRAELGGRLRRHDHQGRRGAHRAGRRLQPVHRQRPSAAPAARGRGRRALHLVPARHDAARDAQAVDRRHAQAARPAGDRRRCGARRWRAARACCRPA